jgi:hypothetical protein
VIPAVRLEEERPRLRVLNVAPVDLALREPIVVGPTGRVFHDGHQYSMSPEAIGIAGTLFLYRGRVRIVAGRCQATHARLFEPGAKSTLPEHRVEHVAAVSGTRAKRYLQREHLLELGPVALEYLTELTHQRPRAWLHDVDRLHGLLVTCGEAALRDALARGLAEHAIGAEYITRVLAEQVTMPAAIGGDKPGRPEVRSSAREPLVLSSLAADRLPFDPPAAAAKRALSGGRVQTAAGARRAGAKRRAWTRASTAFPFDADGGRS